jgi:hypothetical protein
MPNQRQPLSGNYSKSFFEVSLTTLISALPIIAALHTNRPVFRPSLFSLYAATSSSSSKPQTTNGKYLHATRVNENDDETRKSKQCTATRRCFLLQAQASAENCSCLPQQNPRTLNCGQCFAKQIGRQGRRSRRCPCNKCAAPRKVAA